MKKSEKLLLELNGELSEVLFMEGITLMDNISKFLKLENIIARYSNITEDKYYEINKGGDTPNIYLDILIYRTFEKKEVKSVYTIRLKGKMEVYIRKTYLA